MVTPTEAAYLLRNELGPVCAFDDMLADLRRGRYDNRHGLTLYPARRVRNRPLYRLVDVENFVSEAKVAGLACSDPKVLQVVHVPATVSHH